MASIETVKLDDGRYSSRLRVKITSQKTGEQYRFDKHIYSEVGQNKIKAIAIAKEEAKKFEAEMLAKVDSGINVKEQQSITLQEFSNSWLEIIKEQKSLKHYIKSRDDLKLINEQLGRYKLCQLTPVIIQHFYNELDKRKKIRYIVKPQPDFKEQFHAAGYTLSKFKINGKRSGPLEAILENNANVSKQWAEEFCKVSKLPYESMFLETKIEEPYSPITNKSYKTTLRIVLADAKRKRLVVDNYASSDYITFPKQKKHVVEVMNDEEAHKFFETLKNWPEIRAKTCFYIFLLTGMRRGEVAALEWSDIDFERNTIRVNKNIVTVTGYGVIEKDPKTETSSRKLTMPTLLAEQLKEYKKWQDNEIKDNPKITVKKNKLFTRENGDIINPDTFKKWYAKILKAANIEHHTIHSIRHTIISMLIEAGVPITVVSARAGHSKTSTTSDIYAHAFKSADVESAKITDQLFSNNIATNIKTINNSAVNDNNLEINEFKEYQKVKEEMKRIGCQSLTDYYEYLEFKKLNK